MKCWYKRVNQTVHREGFTLFLFKVHVLFGFVFLCVARALHHEVNKVRHTHDIMNVVITVGCGDVDTEPQHPVITSS